MAYYAGIDWGSQEHAACVLDEDGKVVKRLKVKHDREGLNKLLASLAAIAPPELPPVAIERPTGLLVDTLLEAGHPIVPIHPNQLKATRPRYSAAQGKSDPGDAYILADVLRTDGHRLHALKPLSDEIRALRALVRARDDLVAERVALANQLRSLLESFWPGAATIFAKIDSPSALAFLERYPTPVSAKRLGEKRLATFLAAQHYTGRKPARELLANLRRAPTGLAGPLEEDVKGELVTHFVKILQTLVTRLATLKRRIAHDVTQLPRGRILMSFPRIGTLNAAQILAELGDDAQRYPSEAQLAAEGGAAPLTRASGRSHTVTFRYACNKRLRRALTTFADNSRHESAWAADIYHRARARGCHHSHATRILSRAWIRILWRCWNDQTPYLPTRHQGAQPFLNAAQSTKG